MVQMLLTKEGHLTMFGLSFIFLFGPLGMALFQLHKEIKQWIMDPEMCKIIQSWISDHMTVLLVLSIIFGSSFSAIEFCNSNLFQLRICYMNLPRIYRRRFKQRRWQSVIIFENIPQLLLQTVHIAYYSDNQDWTMQYITLSAMIFSLLSIILALFQCYTQKFLFDHQNLLLLRFEVHSKIIHKFGRRDFKRKVEYKRAGASNVIAKILSIDINDIELLKPMACKRGALLIFHIRNVNNSIVDIKESIEKAIDVNELNFGLMKAYGLRRNPSIVGVRAKFISQLQGRVVIAYAGTAGMMVSLRSSLTNGTPLYSNVSARNSLILNPSFQVPLLTSKGDPYVDSVVE